MVPSLTPYDLPSPKWGSICPQDTRMAISPQLIQFMFGSRQSCIKYSTNKYQYKYQY